MTWAEANRHWRQSAGFRWAPENPEPLLIRAWLSSPIAYDGYDPVTIEGALQSVVVLRETGRLPDDVYSDCPSRESLENTDIPIPIVDTVVIGVPISHASIGWFAPDALATKRQSWKRADAEHYNRPVVNVSMAETKTQMVLKATVTTTHVDFYVQGDPLKIEDLLRDAGALGASRSGGLGQVHGWEVLPSPVSWWWHGPGGRLMRALPVALASGTQFDTREATLRAPYWHPRTRALCGVPVQQLGEPLGQIAGDFFVTGHAVRRFRERVPGKRGLSYERALGELIQTLRASHFVKEQNGLELWRGPKPHRLRLRISRCGGGLPQVVTVLRGCDAGWQRGGF